MAKNVSVTLATKQQWEAIADQVRESIAQSLQGNYKSKENPGWQPKKIGPVEQQFNMLQGCKDEEYRYLVMEPTADSKSEGYFQQIGSDLARLIRDVKPELNLVHVTNLQVSIAAQADRVAEIRQRQPQAYFLVNQPAIAPPNTTPKLLKYAGIKVVPEFDLGEFLKEVRRSNRIFIMQNSVPGLPDLFAAIYRRIRDMDGDFRLTIYNPEANYAQRRIREADQIFDRTDEELKTLIYSTQKHFQGQFEMNRKENQGWTAECRFTAGELPFIVYGTEHAIWVGWMWKQQSTNHGMQFHAQAGTEFYQVICTYFDFYWENHTDAIDFQAKIDPTP